MRSSYELLLLPISLVLYGFYVQATQYIFLNSTQYDGFIHSTSHKTKHKSLDEVRQISMTLDTSNPQCRVHNEDTQCLPPFQNIAQNTVVHASSTCGDTKVQRLCNSDGTCQVCDRTSGNMHFSTLHLTDQHTPQNETCWSSALAKPGGQDRAVNLTLSLGKRFEVFYISLVPCSMGIVPDSIAIYRSSDFGRTWRPWHYFSTDCYRAFGLPTTNEHNTHITTANLQEVLCVALKPQDNYNIIHPKRRSMQTWQTTKQQLKDLFNTPVDPTISFSTTLGRPAARPWSPALIDWMTMTNLRISFMRFPPSANTDYRSKRTLSFPGFRRFMTHPQQRHHLSKNNLLLNNFSQRSIKTSQIHTMRNNHLQGHRSARSPTLDFSDLRIPYLQEPELISHKLDNTSVASDSSDILRIPLPPKQSVELGEPDVLSEREFYAFADLVVGGWCKCNGHAKECVTELDGQLTCACEHNTEGVDCERCKQGYMDRPWERATAQNAKSCAQCDCNLHSNECRFSNALYLMSNRVSGGVCENCQHNTAGRNCQHCAEGFYRDWTKPINHDHVCTPCRCHPIGSIIRHDCDRRSGQCRCKQGVTGHACDRCQNGYRQTRSPTNPCTKDFAAQAVALAHTPVASCVSCDTNKERIRLKKFCRKDAVFQATFKSRELHGTMARFEMQVLQIWRLKQTDIYWPEHQKTDSSGISTNGQQEQKEIRVLYTVPVWVRLGELRCKCPEVELGITYLIVTDFEGHSHRGRLELLFTPRTALLPWRLSWWRRLMRFKRRQNRGACDRFQEAAKLKAHGQHIASDQSELQPWQSSNPIMTSNVHSTETWHSQPSIRKAYRAHHQLFSRYNPYAI